MTRSFRAARLFVLVSVFPGLTTLSGCSSVSPSGAQSGPAAQSAEIMMPGDYTLNEDGTPREPHVTLSVPTMNGLAFQFNETGAEQAARRFIDFTNYSWASGSATALGEFSEEQCIYCQPFDDSVISLYETGGWLHGLGYTTNQAEGNYPANTNSPETAQPIDCYVTPLLIHRNKADRCRLPTLEHVPSGTRRLFLIVHWDGSERKMSEVEGKDVETVQSG